MSHNKDVKRTLKNERLEYPIKMMHAYPSVNVGWGAHTMVGNDARVSGYDQCPDRHHRSAWYRHR